jgi:hypothetical protein
MASIHVEHDATQYKFNQARPYEDKTPRSQHKFMGKDTNRTGLSKSVKVRYGGGFGRAGREETIPVNKSAKRIEMERRKQRDYIAGESIYHTIFYLLLNPLSRAQF